MKKATVVRVYDRGELGRRSGQAVLIKLDEPIEYGDEGTTDYVYVSAAQVGRLIGVYDYPINEVYLFPADENGEVLDWWELPGSRRGTDNIRMTMMDAGYDVSSWPKEVR